MLSQIVHFINIDLWEIRLKDLHPIKFFFVKYLRIILLAIRGFWGDRCQKTASVLTYYSLLNVVPIVAVAFAISKGFGLEKMIEKQILQMADKANWQAEITSQILMFSHKLLDQAKGGVIAGVGVVLLFWTVISILGKIEGSLDEIWEVKKPRTLVRKFSDYIAIIVFAPVLLSIASSATILVASQLQMIVKKIALLGVFGPMIFFLLNLLPYVSIWVLLTMLYLVMPNTRIPLRGAIAGGIFAGTLMQIVQWLYIKFQIGAASYGAIYGSFAALPLFLAMLQLSWMIVLFGAEISHAYEHYETYGFQPEYSNISLSSKKRFVLQIFHLLTRTFSQGEKPLSIAEIAERLEIPVQLVRRLLHELTDVGLVVETVRGPDHEVTFQPGRTIEHITIKEVLDVYESRGVHPPSVPPSDQTENIFTHLKNISDAAEKAPGNVMIKEV
jgi:membrane protein